VTAQIFSSSDFEQVLRLTREGKSINQAAAIVEFSPQTIYRAMRDNDDWREQIREARRFANEMIGENARAEMVRRAHDTDLLDKAPAISQRALERVFDTYVPEAKQATQQPEEERADRIAEALDRFTSTVVSLAARSDQALPAGEPE
jgi:IS30 family transposase